MLKRWRYVAVFCEQLMACAARVHVGPATQSFWALYMRERAELRERTHNFYGRTRVSLPAGGVRVADAGVLLELELDEGSPVAAHCVNDGGDVWTRKQAGVRASGNLVLGSAAPQRVSAMAVIDDTAGYHPRHTEWWWSAGVGSARSGEALAWNLVSGVNDPASRSERAVWTGSETYECAPVAFSADLSRIDGADGAQLRFSAEAERSRADNLLLVASEYRAPFGTFSGALPGGAGRAPLQLASGLGVVEHHRARW
ncbi:MAG TPA: DUF2804 family protein [Solirubrobacteraceae bacterium]|jgi:hypothetical protein|nr:DUF2804 family protein [Solirubrobacteraceae bacterium]